MTSARSKLKTHRKGFNLKQFLTNVQVYNSTFRNGMWLINPSICNCIGANRARRIFNYFCSFENDQWQVFDSWNSRSMMITKLRPEVADFDIDGNTESLSSVYERILAG